jgi:hypothetical protein
METQPLETQPFVNRGPVLAWILGAVLLMLLTTLAGAFVWTCWVDAVHRRSLSEPSHSSRPPNAW